jgi:sorbitol-specific phosphotransferase system component IIA
LSAIKLRAGSVQVTHSVNPNTMVLSETGTEFHIKDNGSYELLFPGGDDLSTLEIEKPFIVEMAIEEGASGESLDNIGSNNAVNEVIPAAGTEVIGQDTLLGNIYTVYLFSSRSEEVAEQVNQKFHRAGHDTQVYASETDAGRRYRVAITGFVSRHAAKNFSDVIVGKLGVTGTWIKKERPLGVEAVVEQAVSGESLDNVGSNNAATEAFSAAETKTTRQDALSDYIFKVYLFSSRTEEVAQQVSQKLQEAGHDTQVYIGTIGAELRFRVAVSGFETRQAAKNYSDSVVGTLGVTETWIRKESR